MSFKFNALTGGFNTFTQADLTSIGGSNDLSFNDSTKVKIGAGDDLQLYHNGTDSFLQNYTGNLKLAANLLLLTNKDTDETYASCTDNGAVELYYNNSKKFETYNGGCQMGGDLSFSDSQVANFGTGSDLQIYHDGNDSWIKDSGTRHFNFTAGQYQFLNVGANEFLIKAVADGGVSLYYDNALKLQTNTLGVSVGTTDTVIYDHNISDSYESGVVLDGAGSVQVARYNDQCLLLNRMGLDGTIESFYNDGTYVGGIAVSGSTTVYATSSDYRLKENVTAISDGITRLKTLKPYRFNFISDTTKTVDGFFAHEVTAVPEAIVGEKDAEEMQSLDYAKLTPLLTAALQEAITKIETLETKVAALEAA
tara:strand:+ start:1706 stop:2803 length:1098 start_codon:yes stop_codon:yes gene_type:complete